MNPNSTNAAEEASLSNVGLGAEVSMEPDKPLLWSTYSQERGGWCVWTQQHLSTVAEMVAGPFRTRQEADDILGALLGQLEAPNINYPPPGA